MALPRWYTIIALLCFSVLLTGFTFPENQGFVNDFANILTAPEEASLTTELNALDRRSNVQLVVVTVDSLQGGTVENFTRALFNTWGIGHRESNRGILLLVAPNDRTMRIQVGTGLEAILPAGVTRQVIDQQLRPAFRSQAYARGIQASIQALTRTIETPAGSVEDDLPSSRHGERTGTDATPLGIVILIVAVGVIIGIRLMLRPQTLGSHKPRTPTHAEILADVTQVQKVVTKNQDLLVELLATCEHLSPAQTWGDIDREGKRLSERALVQAEGACEASTQRNPTQAKLLATLAKQAMQDHAKLLTSLRETIARRKNAADKIEGALKDAHQAIRETCDLISTEEAYGFDAELLLRDTLATLKLAENGIIRTAITKDPVQMGITAHGYRTNPTEVRNEYPDPEETLAHAEKAVSLAKAVKRQVTETINLWMTTSGQLRQLEGRALLLRQQVKPQRGILRTLQERYPAAVWSSVKEAFLAAVDELESLITTLSHTIQHRKKTDHASTTASDLEKRCDTVEQALLGPERRAEDLRAAELTARTKQAEARGIAKAIAEYGSRHLSSASSVMYVTQAESKLHATEALAETRSILAVPDLWKDTIRDLREIESAMSKDIRTRSEMASLITQTRSGSASRSRATSSTRSSSSSTHDDSTSWNNSSSSDDSSSSSSSSPCDGGSSGSGSDSGSSGDW